MISSFYTVFIRKYMVSFYAASVIVTVKCCSVVVFSKFLLFSKENAPNLAMVRSSHAQYEDSVYLIKQFDSSYFTSLYL